MGMEPRNEGSDQDWTLERAKKDHIIKILNLSGGNKKKAAKRLGVDPTTIWRKMQ
jgi:transcriptional regulator of acetoin/glycerol metabolism